MPKKHMYIIMVLLAAMMLIAIVYIYYDRQLDKLEKRIVSEQPASKNKQYTYP